MFRIIVEGDYACFTRPDCKVERATYPVPTPSALVGLIKAVYWKPAIEYVIDKIVVFNPIEHACIKRNERKKKTSQSDIIKQMSGKRDKDGNLTDPRDYFSLGDSGTVTQRSTVCLKNVKYGIEFHFNLTGYSSEKDDESPAKHASILERRLKCGQFFKVPCLGCREFATKSVTLVDEFDEKQISPSLKGDFDLGVMLYGLTFQDNLKKQKEKWDRKNCTDNADPHFYHPHMVDGVIDVNKYWEVRK